MIADEAVLSLLEERFGRQGEWISHAPGRVNLIGEHVDYAGGLVLPVAIDRGVKIAAAHRTDRRVRVTSRSFEGVAEFDLETMAPGETTGGAWARYFQGVADQFERRRHRIPGLDVVVDSDLPIGSGLSSSAALCVAAAQLFAGAAGIMMEPHDAALLAQAAEHGPYVGMKCGIMDQYISALGRRDSALLIDCHDLTAEPVEIPSDLGRIVILDSMKKRGLVDSEYNQRRRESEEGLARLRRLANVDFETLRHVPADAFYSNAHELPERVRRRVRHHVTENQRVRQCAEALRRGDMRSAGKLIDESHESLRADYEVSCAELDQLVEITRQQPGVFGCRMTGGGFGGCAVALVEPRAVDEVVREVQRAYNEARGVVPDVYVSEAAEGAGFHSLPLPTNA